MRHTAVPAATPPLGCTLVFCAHRQNYTGGFAGLASPLKNLLMRLRLQKALAAQFLLSGVQGDSSSRQVTQADANLPQQQT